MPILSEKLNNLAIAHIFSSLLLIFGFSELGLASEQNLGRYSIGLEMMRGIEGGGQLLDTEFQYFEGQIQQKQQNLSTIEKHLDLLLHYQFAITISESFGLTAVADALYRRANSEEKNDSGQNNSYWSNTEVEPKLMFYYKTPTSVYLFGGMGLNYSAKSTLEYDIGSIDGKTVQDAAMVHYPILGLTKKANAWQGSIYGILGRESSRHFTTTVSLAEEPPVTGNETNYQASTYGLSGKAKISVIDFTMDLKSVQAGEGGPKTEDGITIYEDFNQISLEGAYSSGNLKGFLGFGYKSLSYSSNAFMAFDNLPMFRGTLGGTWGAGATYLSGGINYLSGQDTQSLTEFNARYSFISYGVFCALSLGF